jgi:threonine aldolase
MQLASKMRFIGVQFEVLFGTDLWLRSATHANAMARRLADAVADVPGVQLTRQPEANSVYAILPADVTARLQEQVFFYVWDHMTGEVRWVCAFDTTEQDVDDFAEAVRKEMADR